MSARRASALVVALWVIAVLSVMVLSFSVEAKLQTSVNVYVRERNRVNRLVDAGQALAEVVLSDYSEVADWSEDEDIEALLEDDRWILEKRNLKTDSRCRIGPIVLDEEQPENGVVTVDIELANAGAVGAININELYEGGDAQYRLRWEMIFRQLGIPEDYEVETDDGRLHLVNLLIGSWNDWRDNDDTISQIDGEDAGAELNWYEERYEKDNVDDEDRRFPRNAALPDIQELGYIRGWRDFPVVLTGGVLNPDERDEKARIHIRGLMSLNIFGVSGSSKVNVNNCTVAQLLTVPGIFNEEDEDDLTESTEAAQAIISTLKEKPDYNVDESRDWWPYKDWNDLVQRVKDAADVDIGNEAAEYFIYVPDKNSIFKVKITGESMGMTREVNAECYVKDKKIRYIKWRED